MSSSTRKMYVVSDSSDDEQPAKKITKLSRPKVNGRDVLLPIPSESTPALRVAEPAKKTVKKSRPKANGLAVPLPIPSEGHPALLVKVNDAEVIGRLASSLLPFVSAVLTWAMTFTDIPTYASTFFPSLNAALLSSVIARSVPLASLPILIAYHKGAYPSESSIAALPSMQPATRYQTLGMYLHLGRMTPEGKTVLDKGSYLGSAAGESGESYGGFSNQIGLNRRIATQHSSPTYRRKELSTRKVKHYSDLYLDNDTWTEHTWAILSYFTIEGANTALAILGIQASSRTVDIRRLLVQITESTLLLFTGLYTNGKPLCRIVAGNGGVIPTLASGKFINRAPGLENLGGSEGAKSRGRLGGLSAKKTYAQRLGLTDVSRASLTAYCVSKGMHQHLVQGGYTTSDSNWLADFTILAEGGALKKNLYQKNGYLITASQSDALDPFLPSSLTSNTDSKYLLLFPTTGPKGQRVSLDEWIKKYAPATGQIYRQLEVGELDDVGQPTGKDMRLSAWQTSQAVTGQPDEQDLTPVLRCKGQQLAFDYATAKAWDSDNHLYYMRKRKEGNFPWTHVKRFHVFAAWVKYSAVLYRQRTDQQKEAENE